MRLLVIILISFFNCLGAANDLSAKEIKQAEEETEMLKVTPQTPYLRTVELKKRLESKTLTMQQAFLVFLN